MGYSSRYHAVSLAAVFLALAAGILIGIGLGDNVVADTEANLRESLEGDIDDARRRADDLSAQLARANEFSARAYPALVGGRMEGDRVGVIALGDLSDEVGVDIESALEPTGAILAEISVVRMPPDLAGLSERLDRSAYADLTPTDDRLERLGRRLGREMAQGRGRLLARTRTALFARSSGQGKLLDRVIVARQPPTGGDAEQEGESRERFEQGLIEGLSSAGVPVVGVERSEDEKSSVSLFSSQGMPTVDHVDLISGRVSMVFALLGADGDFGVKPTADSLLPELLVSAARRQAGR